MFDLYKNTPVGDVTTYVRPFQTISNGPLSGPNTLTIFEEKIIVLPDESTQRVELGTVVEATITDPNEVFNIVHPVTGEVTGTKTFAQLKIDYEHSCKQRLEGPGAGLYRHRRHVSCFAND